MLELTNRKLKELGKELNAYYINGNPYTFGDDLHYIEALEHESKGIDFEKLNNIVDELKILSNGAKRLSAYQIAYSCGNSGCSGQLYKLMAYNSTLEKMQVIGFIMWA